MVEIVDLKSIQRWFESNLGYASIAQLVEQQTFNLRVVGSSPTGGTKLVTTNIKGYTMNMTITEEKIERSLKVIDRCDACGSQAFVMVKLISGELMFCGHHYVKNQDKLNNQAYEIIDEREYINAKPSQSSN